MTPFTTLARRYEQQAFEASAYGSYGTETAEAFDVDAEVRRAAKRLLSSKLSKGTPAHLAAAELYVKQHRDGGAVEHFIDPPAEFAAAVEDAANGVSLPTLIRWAEELAK